MEINIYEAKNKLSRLVDAALAGEEVIIARDNNPLVKLTVIKSNLIKREFIRYKGKISSNFDDPLADFNEYV